MARLPKTADLDLILQAAVSSSPLQFSVCDTTVLLARSGIGIAFP
jgi:hypothetical protein